MILVTGSLGSVGRELIPRLEELGHDVVGYDLPGSPYAESGACWLNVTDEDEVMQTMAIEQPDVIFHLAGAKHAPDGELDPWHVLNVNAVGTRNVLEHCGDAKVILASTCKACDPETAYGASKLIAERMVLNAGGVVVRFYNIPESDGNVFRLWEELPESEPIPWTDCFRYFSPMDSCIDLLVQAMDLPTGRYAPKVGQDVHIGMLAQQHYPGRERMMVPRRRGDREAEPKCARSEQIDEFDDYFRITNQHDPVTAEIGAP